MCHFASLSFDFRKTGLSEIWNNEWEPAIKHRELNLPLCDDLDGWDGVGCTGAPRGGIYVCIWLIHFPVQQELTQNCKATIFQ